MNQQIQQIELSIIRIDGDTQSRVELDNDTVEDYTEAMLAGAEFPPVVVFFDGVDYWLADGFHRYFAIRMTDIESIAAEVRNGSMLDAQLYSFGVNSNHGLRRTNADKRKAVAGALKHPVSCKWSNNQVAKHCGVSDKTVAAVRNSHFGNSEVTQQERSYTTKHGTEAVMKTANIGKKSAAVKAASTLPCETPAAQIDAEAVREAVGQPLAGLSDEELVRAKAIVDGTLQDVASSEAEEPPEYSELDHAHDVIQDLRAELAIAQMGDVAEEDKQEASRLIAELRGEVKSLAAQLEIAEQARNALLNENAAMKSQLAHQRRQIDKLKQGVGA